MTARPYYELRGGELVAVPSPAKRGYAHVSVAKDPTALDLLRRNYTFWCETVHVPDGYELFTEVWKKVKP